MCINVHHFESALVSSGLMLDMHVAAHKVSYLGQCRSYGIWVLKYGKGNRGPCFCESLARMFRLPKLGGRVSKDTCHQGAEGKNTCLLVRAGNGTKAGNAGGCGQKVQKNNGLANEVEGSKPG
jgi:hypothetical protein